MDQQSAWNAPATRFAQQSQLSLKNAPPTRSPTHGLEACKTACARLDSLEQGATPVSQGATSQQMAQDDAACVQLMHFVLKPQSSQSSAQKTRSPPCSHQATTPVCACLDTGKISTTAVLPVTLEASNQMKGGKSAQAAPQTTFAQKLQLNR